MNKINIKEYKISMPLITDDELTTINNNIDMLTDEFIRTAVKDKDLCIAQHIIKRLKQENEQLKQLNKIVYVDKSKKVLDELEERLKEEKLLIGDITTEIGEVISLILVKLKELKGCDK